MFDVKETQQKTNSKFSRPRVAFLGVGWIGKNRLEAIRESGLVDIVSISDPHAEGIEKFCRNNDFQSIDIYNDLLQEDIDGVVIATPSALHKQQSIEALTHGKAVFCQKPLACNYAETKEVLDIAKGKNLLLMTDMSYRYTHGLTKIKDAIDSGELGEVYAAHLTFHNAYGPDKSWYYNSSLSGGGCMMDLGIHLIDMLYWIFPDLEVENLCSNLFSKGKPIVEKNTAIEDYGMAHINFNKMSAQVCSSWNLSAGKDAIIEMKFYGTNGGASFRNIDGSFYDFKAEIFKGTKSHVLSLPPDNWGGRAAVDWAARLAESKSYNNESDNYLKTAKTLDSIYGR